MHPNYNKFIKDIRSVQFHWFGIKENDCFDISDILKYIKIFKNCSELECELNKLVKYIYDGKRILIFNEFRQFPYICHGNINSFDLSGLAKNYTSSDIYLIKFIRKFVFYKHGQYTFFDVDFIIKNTKRIKLDECSIINMPIDEILR